jgi:hypothetical protein
MHINDVIRDGCLAAHELSKVPLDSGFGSVGGHILDVR